MRCISIWAIPSTKRVAGEILVNLGQGRTGLLSALLDQIISVSLGQNRVAIECRSFGHGGYSIQPHIYLQRVGDLVLGYSKGPEVQEEF
jgi:hypothetical protein